MRSQLERKRAQLEKARARIADPRRLIGERQLRLDRLRQRVEDLAREALSSRAALLRKAGEQLAAQHPRERLHRMDRAVREREEKLRLLVHRALAARRHRFEGLAGRLDNLSPLRVLARGYAVAFDERGHAVTDAARVRAGRAAARPAARGRAFDEGRVTRRWDGAMTVGCAGGATGNRDVPLPPAGLAPIAGRC